MGYGLVSVSQSVASQQAAQLAAQAVTQAPQGNTLSYGNVPSFGGPTPYGWRNIKIGNGGIVTHFDSAADGTLVCGTDSFGGYIWNSTANQWQQILNTTSFSSGVDSSGYPLGNGFDTIVIDQHNTNNLWVSWYGNIYKSINRGVSFAYAGNWPNQQTNGYQSQDGNPSKSWNPILAVDPINSSVIYASTVNKGLYVSTDGGSTWTLNTTFAAGLPTNAGSANSYPKTGTDSTAHDPSLFSVGGTVTFSNNSANFGFPTGTNQVVQIWSASDPTKQFIGSVTTINSSTSFTMTLIAVFGSGSKSDWNVSYVNNNGPGNINSGGHRISFDVSAAPTGGKTSNIYVHTYGVGTWVSTNAGSTWSLTSATNRPATIRSMASDLLGTLWVVTDEYPGVTPNAWKYASGTWTAVSPGAGGVLDYDAVAVDYANSGSVTTVAYSFNSNPVICISKDGGSTWTVNGNGSITSSASDVAWMDGYYGSVSPANLNGGAQLCFDRTGSGRLYQCVEGVWYCQPSTAGGTQNLVMTQMTRGIEQFISIRCISPNKDSVVVTSWDFPGFYTSNFTAYPTSSQVLPPGASLPNGLELGHDIDWLWSNPNRLVCVVGDNFNSSANTHDSYSSDGGQTWTAMSSLQTLGGGGGFIAISDTNTWVKVFNSHGTGTQAPKETTSGGTSWSTPAFFSSYPNADWGNFQFYATSCRFIDSDKANGDIYLYCVNDGTGSDRIFKRTFAGTWSVTTLGSLGIGVIASLNGIIKSSGVAGNIFMTPGLQAAPHGTTGSWYFTTDGWSSVSKTVTGFKEVQAYGFGAKFAGASFPTIFAVGWYTGTALINGVSTSVTSSYGVWMCKNFDNTTGNGTWSLCCDPSGTYIGSPYPLGILSNVTDIDGDKTTPGKVYCFTNGGAFWGEFS